MKKILVIFNILIISIVSQAQTNKFTEFLDSHDLDLEVRAAVIIGGMSPMDMPVEIREILKYSPEYNGLVGINITKWVAEKYGITSGIRFENKGMETSAKVKSYYTQIVNQGDKVAGYWTGSVNTITKISYLTIPLLANFKLHDRFKMQVGGYFSYNMTGKFHGKVHEGYLRENTPMGEKLEFTGDQYASYDFSDDLDPIAYGTQLSWQWRAINNFYLFNQFTWGLNNIFKSDFKTVSFNMYPIYVSLGASYEF